MHCLFFDIDLRFRIRAQTEVNITRIPSQVWYNGLPIAKSDITDLMSDGSKRVICLFQGCQALTARNWGC